jgi:tRNA A37 threonylcarbamoyladenosine synthetase subunit TsaC/SUA5/YrdC
VTDPNVYLTATDTTIGFVSQDAARLDRIKGRPAGKHYITALPSLAALKRRGRVPAAHANRIRRSRRTSFVLPDGRSWRIIQDPTHRQLIRDLGWAYTSSANRSGQSFDERWARKQADVVIEPLVPRSAAPSQIYRLSHRRIRKIR